MKRDLIDVLWLSFIVGMIVLSSLLWCTRHAAAAERPDLETTEHLVLGGGPTLNGNTNPKYASLGYEWLFRDLSVLAECRGIFSEQFNGACSLVFSARVETVSGLFMRLGVGPAWYFRVDDRVSSNLNANIQGCAGITSGGVDVGGCLSHFSNAGWVPPNLGRDFVGPVVAIHL